MTRNGFSRQHRNQTVNVIGSKEPFNRFQFSLDVAQSAQTYTILTIGDGLVAQIPALIVSTATGIMITRASSDNGENFAEGSINQLMGNAKTLVIVESFLHDGSSGGLRRPGSAYAAT